MRSKIEVEVARILESSEVKSVLIAVSGGADSVALLTACHRVSSRLQLRIEAVNCNFHLRAEESDRDSEFTARLCKSLGIKLHSLEYDVMKFLSKNPGMSIEMACRQLRYDDFFRLLEEENLDRVAVAHNSDDDIETLMINMLRGSGSRGLKGMDRDNGRVIRPLLGISRKEIENYLIEVGIDHITDSSNLTSEFRRNFIRREVIPLIERRWPGARKSLSKTVEIMKEESAIIEDYYKNRLERLSPQKNTFLIYAQYVTTGTLLRFLEQYGGNAEIAEEIMASRHRSFEHHIWTLSDKYIAVLERDRLIIEDSTESKASPVIIWSKLSINTEVMAEVKGNKDHNVVYLPSDETAYTIRSPKTGDRMSPLGMRGTRLVSDIISDARLERKQKDLIRVLERNSDGEIIWVTGLKRSRHDLINASSHHCFKAEYQQLDSEPTFIP